MSKKLDAEAPAPRPPEAPPHEGGRRGDRSSRFWLGVLSLSLAAGFVLLAVYLLFFVRHVGHFHFRHP